MNPTGATFVQLRSQAAELDESLLQSLELGAAVRRHHRDERSALSLERGTADADRHGPTRAFDRVLAPADETRALLGEAVQS